MDKRDISNKKLYTWEQRLVRETYIKNITLKQSYEKILNDF